MGMKMAVLEKKQKFTYMEYLRVISCLGVIKVHVTGPNWRTIDVGSFNWIVQTMYNAAGTAIPEFLKEANPLIALGSAGIFALFKGEKGRERIYDPAKRSTQIMEWTGSRTLGIYLFHFMVLKWLDYSFGLNVATWPAVFSAPILTLLIFGISLPAVSLMKKLPVIQAIVS